MGPEVSAQCAGPTPAPSGKPVVKYSGILQAGSLKLFTLGVFIPKKVENTPGQGHLSQETVTRMSLPEAPGFELRNIRQLLGV